MDFGLFYDITVLAFKLAIFLLECILPTVCVLLLAFALYRLVLAIRK